MNDLSRRIGDWLLAGWILLVCGYYFGKACVALGW